MKNPGEKCPFCHVDRDVIIENQHAMAILDLYPVSAGHTLVIPKIHITSVFDLPKPVYVACFDLVLELKSMLQARYNPDGFNVEINCGIAAGQTVMHAHIHVLPRRHGDMQHPGMPFGTS